MDLISRQAAIDVIRFECGEWTGLAKTIENKINELPPAQPELLSDAYKKQYGHGCLTIRLRHQNWRADIRLMKFCRGLQMIGGKNMSDLISRQAAIGSVQGIGQLATLPDNDAVIRMSAVEYVLYNLPSAQPEIIRCKDCMHNGSFDTDCPIDWAGKDYCNFAERRTDD